MKFQKMSKFYLYAVPTIFLLGIEVVRAFDNDPKTILLKAQQYELCIKSGRVVLHKITLNKPSSESELRRIFKNDPKMLQIELEIAKQLPSREIENEKLLFDNEQNKLLRENFRDNDKVYHRVLFTPKVSKIMIKQAKGETNIFTEKPQWPPYGLYELWLARFWSRRLAAIKSRGAIPKLVNYDPNTGIAIIQINYPDNQTVEKIWINTLQGHIMSRLQFFSQRTGKPILAEEERAFYKRYDNNIWYPWKHVHIRYNAEGKRLLWQTTSIVKDVQLNITLSDKDFEFGDVPPGAFVQDNRFNPPLVYIQGHRQFTDEELFKMARNRELLNDPKWMGYEMPLGRATLLGYLIAGLGLVLTVVSLYMARRFYRLRKL